MRHHFQTQPDLQITPIEKIRLPLKSRDELPPIGHQTLRDNVALLDDELLQQINARIAAAGRERCSQKKGGAPVTALEVKVDSYVLEADVHFPTDLNLLWDAGRKCVDLIEKYRDRFGYALPGWRKVCGLRRDELQPARHRTGTARAAASTMQHPRAGGLRPPTAKPPAKSDRRSVFVAGDFWQLERDQPKIPLRLVLHNHSLSQAALKTFVFGQKLLNRAQGDI
jgi:hypothetical protein